MGFQPEIVKGDELYHDIYFTIRKNRPKTILEIGSANGKGSTQAIIEALNDGGLLNKTKVYCIESSPERYQELLGATRNYPLFNAINASSVPVNKYMKECDVKLFMDQKRFKFNIHDNYSLETVLTWRKDEIDSILTWGIPQNGIAQAINLNNSQFFSMVIIDGSAFTANEEIRYLLGAGTIIMDDVLDIKSITSFFEINIIYSFTYHVVIKNHNYRNGYAIFEMKDTQFLNRTMVDI